VAFEGLLSAKVTEEWYWQPYEWEGMNEPVPGHGLDNTQTGAEP
jgi:hypothetical protein